MISFVKMRRHRNLSLDLILCLAHINQACSAFSSTLPCLHCRPWNPSVLLRGEAPATNMKPVASIRFGYSVGLLSLRGGQAYSGYEDEDEEDSVYNEEEDGDEDDDNAKGGGDREAEYGCVADEYGVPGRGYHGDGLEWVSGKRSVGSADVSYQLQPDENERVPIEATSLGDGSQRDAAMTGSSLIRRMDRGLTTENMRAPMLRPLDLSVSGHAASLLLLLLLLSSSYPSLFLFLQPSSHCAQTRLSSQNPQHPLDSPQRSKRITHCLAYVYISAHGRQA